MNLLNVTRSSYPDGLTVHYLFGMPEPEKRNGKIIPINRMKIVFTREQAQTELLNEAKHLLNLKTT